MNAPLDIESLWAAIPLVPPTSMLIVKGWVFRAGLRNTQICQSRVAWTPSVPTLKRGARGISVQNVFPRWAFLNPYPEQESGLKGDPNAMGGVLDSCNLPAVAVRVGMQNDG